MELRPPSVKFELRLTMRWIPTAHTKLRKRYTGKLETAASRTAVGWKTGKDRLVNRQSIAETA